MAGGNALTGRQVAPLLAAAGFSAVAAGPARYVDRTRPGLVDSFIRRTFIAMLAAVRDDAVAAGLSTGPDFDRGIAELHRTAEDDGTFHYTFVKAVAVRPANSPTPDG